MELDITANKMIMAACRFWSEAAEAHFAVLMVMASMSAMPATALISVNVVPSQLREPNIRKVTPI